MSAAPHSRNGIAPKAAVLVAGLISSWVMLAPAVAAAPAAVAAAASGKTTTPATRELPQLLACMRANSPTRLRGQRVTMELREHGELMRTLRGQLYVKRDTVPGSGANGTLRANLRITEPEALAGGSYLITQTQDYLHSGMYVYLPSVRRVRRITGSVADGSLMGTQFSYDEFKQLQSAFGDLQATLETPTTLDGRDVEQLLFASAGGKDARYDRVRAWVDRESCLPLKAEFYDGERVVKRLSAPASAIQHDGGLWYLKRIDMLDVLADATTTLSAEPMAVVGSPAKLFDPEQFYKAP